METPKDDAATIILAPEVTDTDAARQRLKTILEIQRRNKFRCETITPETLNESNLKEISDFFRFIFNNAWGEFAVCTDCDSQREEGMKMSAMQVFGTGEEYVPVDIMDSITNAQMPNCPCCSKKMKIFHNPYRTLANMKKKLQKQGHVTLLRQENENDRVSGFIFGYGATLREEFEGEWKNRYNYMLIQGQKHERDFGKLLQSLRGAFPDVGFNDDTQVFAWNCIATAPWARFSKPLAEMIREFFSTLPEEQQKKFVVGEAQMGSTAQQLFRWAGARDVNGFLNKNNIIMAGPLGPAIPKFIEY